MSLSLSQCQPRQTHLGEEDESVLEHGHVVQGLGLDQYPLQELGVLGIINRQEDRETESPLSELFQSISKPLRNCQRRAGFGPTGREC